MSFLSRMHAPRSKSNGLTSKHSDAKSASLRFRGSVAPSWAGVSSTASTISLNRLNTKRACEARAKRMRTRRSSQFLAPLPALRVHTHTHTHSHTRTHAYTGEGSDRYPHNVTNVTEENLTSLLARSSGEPFQSNEGSGGLRDGSVVFAVF